MFTNVLYLLLFSGDSEKTVKLQEIEVKNENESEEEEGKVS